MPPFDEALGTLDDNADMIREYWRDVRANWQATVSRLRRTYVYLGVLAAAFGFILAGGINEVSFSGLKVADLDFVLLTIPAVGAYLIFSASALLASSMQLQWLHDNLALHYWPKMLSQQLQLYVRPIGDFADLDAIAQDKTSTYLISRTLNAVMTVRAILVVVLPPIIDVFALFTLIVDERGHVVARVAVVAFSGLMLVGCVPSWLFIVDRGRALEGPETADPRHRSE